MMLTADLLRVTKRKSVIEPKYLDVEDSEANERAALLCRLFRDGVGGARGGLDQNVESAIGHGTDFVIWRGLAKLLYDRSTFETVCAVDPVELRRAVFEASADAGVFDDDARREVLVRVADQLSLTPEEVDSGLYSDLEVNQVLTEHDGLEPRALLNSYNLALAQAVLYRAVSLEITLPEPDPNKLRYLMQMLKFHRLMFRARREADSWVLTIDGPASLFSKSRKYGLQMAVFLPALVLVEEWSLVAAIDFDGDGNERTLSLDSTTGLVSHYRARGQWVAEEERWFEERFAALESGWELSRQGAVIELADGEALVPDYVMRSPDGEEVFVEIVGFWRLAYLKRRIALLDEVDVPLVLVVAERLKTDRAKLEASRPEVFFFKGVILADKVLESAQAALESQA